MTDIPNENTKADVWFVYDGDCPICGAAAHALQIRRTVGNLNLVNAREAPEHPLLKDVHERGLDLDEGMVLKYQDSYYHGDDALHMMAMLGSGQGWFNRMNAMLFRSKTLARLCYPFMRAGRNALLRLRGVQKIRNLEIDREKPLFSSVFGESWDILPPVMKRHYAVRPFSDDVVQIEGHLNVSVSPFVSLISRITGMMVAQSGDDIPVTVVFRSGETGGFHFDRTFHFPGKGAVPFHSRLEWISGNHVVEFLRFGLGWKSQFAWEGGKVLLRHKGYVWRVLGVMIPLPLEIVLGKCQAEEVPLSDEKFSMWMQVTHPLLGKTFGYSGEFRLVEGPINCA